jgi:hypothetical protein
MTVNAFKNVNQEYLPIRRDEKSNTPTASTPFITLGDEVLVNGVWWKATSYSLANGFGWQAMTGQSSGGTASGLTWVQITASQIMTEQFGYILQNDTAPISLTLPSSSAVGNIIIISGDLGCQGFTISQSAGQQMVLSPTIASTIGTAGLYTVPAPAQGLMLTLVCSVADTRWIVMSNYAGYVS